MYRWLGLFVIAAAFFSVNTMNANTANATDLRLCTGSKKGNYYYTGLMFKQTLQGSLNVELINTKGSMDNLKRIVKGECDAGIAQSDAWYVYNKRKSGAALQLERVGTLFSEYAHLICNEKAGVGDFGDLEDGDHTVAIGKSGSGSWVTFNGLIEADKEHGGDAYSKIPTSNKSGSRALNAVMEGREVSCLFYVASLGTGYMKKVSANSEGSKKLELLDVKDKDFNDIEDPKGGSVYEPTEIESNAYPGFKRWTDIDTVKVQAIVFVSQKWVDENEDEFEEFSDVFLPVARNVRATKGLNE